MEWLQTANHVKAFLDQVLEEVNDEEAIALQNTEDEIVHRERNLR
jgi:DNA-binding phage protein